MLWFCTLGLNAHVGFAILVLAASFECLKIFKSTVSSSAYLSAKHLCSMLPIYLLPVVNIDTFSTFGGAAAYLILCTEDLYDTSVKQNLI